MKMIDKNLYKVTSKELRDLKASDFEGGDHIYIDEKYCVDLIKKEYDRFSMESRLQDEKTFKYIPVHKWPDYINDFLYR